MPKNTHLTQGGTYHGVARLKHLTEQNATLLPGKRLSERIQGTRVPGVRRIWALQDKGRAAPMAPSRAISSPSSSCTHRECTL